MPRRTLAISTLLLCSFSMAQFGASQTTTTAATEVATQKPSPCLDAVAHPEYRQLDYWVGNWEVFSANNKKSSDVTVAKVLNNCGLSETWKAARGPNGDGLGMSTYNARTSRWEYFWISAAGATSHFEGTLLADGMRFRLLQPMPGGVVRLRHWSLIKLPDGKVRELSVGSNDDGVTWTTEYDLLWVPKKS